MAKAARTTPPNLDGWATAKDALTTALGELQKADLAAKQKKAAAAATQPSIHP
jgi:hypothetical protein